MSHPYKIWGDSYILIIDNVIDIWFFITTYPLDGAYQCNFKSKGAHIRFKQRGQACCKHQSHQLIEAK